MAGSRQIGVGPAILLYCPLRVQEKRPVSRAQGERAANRLRHRCAERRNPSTMIVPAPSDSFDDLNAVDTDTLQLETRPLLRAQSPGKRWKRGVVVGE